MVAMNSNVLVSVIVSSFDKKKGTSKLIVIYISYEAGFTECFKFAACIFNEIMISKYPLVFIK
jgi:hypothetical protein